MNLKIGLAPQNVALSIGLMFMTGCSSFTFVRSNSFARIAVPASPHHSEYVDYQCGRLTKAELLDRLPHVALIGDSLSRNFYVSSLPSSVLRAKINYGRDWFLDTDFSTNSVDSVYEQLEEITPLVATEYSSVGGFVDSGVKQRHFPQFLWPLNFSDQVDLILRGKRFPDLLTIWIGHNNVNWVHSLDAAQRQDPDAGLGKIAANFRENYARQLKRLLDQARKKPSRTAIVVFGEVNFESYFKARETAETLKRTNPKLFPYLEIDYRYFESMKPAFRANMIKLALLENDELHKLVNKFSEQLKDSPQVTLRYSDALSTVDISRVDLIHRMDAWHPSPQGHSVLAAAAFDALKPSLEFLGIAP